MRSIFFKYFGVFSALYLAFILLDMEAIGWYMKPFLLPLLLLAVYYQEHFATKKLLMGALVFSWMGDVILLFSSRSQWFFISGLIAFLIAHVIFMVLFNQERKSTNTGNHWKIGMGLSVIILYLVLILSILLPNLGALRLPVLVYALTICCMLSTAYIGYFRWHTPAKSWILFGATSFVVSDTILAFNKFYQPVWMASFFIMLTYLVAQYCIASGVVRLQKG